MANYFAPGWQTDELGEEWVEPESTSPTYAPSELPDIGVAQQSIKNNTTNTFNRADSIRAKRGSLRMLGHAGSSARALPRSTSSGRSGSENLQPSSTRGVPSGEFLVPRDDGISGNDSPEEEVGGGIGTFVVKQGVEDDRGKALLARANGQGGNGAVKRDIFGKNALERMFEPPSPPNSSEPLTTNSRIPSGENRAVGSSEAQPPPRKISHAYTPVNPSRLSKSITPSSASSSMVESTHHIQDGFVQDGFDSLIRDDTLPEDGQSLLEEDELEEVDLHGSRDSRDDHYVEDGEEAEVGEEGEEYPEMPFHSGEVDPEDLENLHENQDHYEYRSDGAQRIPSGETGTCSAATTIKAAQTSFDPPTSPFQNGDPSHSTIYASRAQKSPSKSKSKQPKTPLAAIVDPRLQLFRSTYDTYTREHLSALADSFVAQVEDGHEGSSGASPAEAVSGDLRAWLPDETDTPWRLTSVSPGSAGEGISGTASGNGIGSEEGGSSGSAGSMADSRSSKRLRLSPPSPKRAPRDWGAQGRALMDKIRVVEDSTTSASRSEASNGLVDAEGPTIDYNANPTPPLEKFLPAKPNRPPNQHRSNPSTASSGYLRRAEDLMAKIRDRVVSDSASGFESSPAMVSQGAFSDADMDEDGQLARSQSKSVQSNGKGKGKGKAVGPSPRRMLRRLSASDEIRRSAHEPSDEEFSEESSNDQHDWEKDQEEQHLQRSMKSTSSNQYSAPRPPIDQNQADDLNRFVSATTIATTTTMTNSFVKHSGGPPPPTKGMRMIKPEEVQGLMTIPQGKMKFDSNLMRWIRDRPNHPTSVGGLGRVDEARESKSASAESEDVFAGMESLREETGPLMLAQAPAERNDLEEEESDVSSEEEDGQQRGDQERGTQIADQSHYNDGGDSEFSDNDSEDLLGQIEQETMVSPPGDINSTQQNISPPTRPVPHHASSAPAILTPAHLGPNNKPIRSALRNPNSDTPGIKKRTGFHPDLTPAPVGLRSASATRSVSFSDGRKSGKIRNLEIELQLTVAGGEGNLFDKSGSSLLPSARTRRINDVLLGIEDLSLEETTPSKPSRNSDPIREPKASSSAGPSASMLSGNDDDNNDTTITEPVYRRGHQSRNPGDGTFLTECSFGVAHDLLVKIITDVQPFEPYWEELVDIDLSEKGLDSVARLKEFLPKLELVNLDNNTLSYLSGIPAGVHTLHAASNRLTTTTSFNSLRNLRFLDVSRNQLDSVSQLTCLTQLETLVIDGNKLKDISPLFALAKLSTISAKNNRLSTIDMKNCFWRGLKELDLSENCLTEVRGVSILGSLRVLNLENNLLTSLHVGLPMTSLRTLRISQNEFSSIDFADFPRLKTFYADDNKIQTLHRTDGSSSRLISLSMRNQLVKSLRIPSQELQNVTRLYISGNDLSKDFFNPRTPLSQLVYLEAAACKLSEWSSSYASTMPSLQILNLNYNYLSDLGGLSTMSSLRKLTLVGNRIDGLKSKSPVAGLRGLENLEECDLRMNPLTLPFYLPLLAMPSPDHLDQRDNNPNAPANKTAILLGRPGYTSNNRSSTSTTFHHLFGSSTNPDEDWATLDRTWRRKLPDEWFAKRLVYRGNIMAGCEKIRVLDGLEVVEGEKRKARELLRRSRGDI